MTAPTYDPREVANYILWRSYEEKVPVDHLKLQKLVYIAHGWHLGITGRPLLSDDPCAWPYGPVCPAVYHEFKQFGSSPISGYARTADPITGVMRAVLPGFLPDSKRVVDQVWDNYKKYSGLQLSKLTHQPGTPWSAVTADGCFSRPIPADLIRQHYHTLAEKNLGAAQSH